MSTICSECDSNGDKFKNACRNKHLNCLKYIYENGYYTWDLNSIFFLIVDVKLVEYAFKNNCPWSQYTTFVAAMIGNIDCLKFAHENGCPWHVSTIYAAARENNIECLRYAYENGCPWDTIAIQHAYEQNNIDCLRYMYHICKDKITDEEIEKYVQSKIDEWKSLVDIGRKQMLGIPADIWNIIDTYW